MGHHNAPIRAPGRVGPSLMARIVLIDDEARLLQTLARFLEHQGHHVVRGASFADVADHLRPGRFEVLVTDIVMPEFDGMKVLREVVEVRQCQEPVILITGEPNLETASEAVRRGAFDYISKPVTKDKLLEAVSRGLRHVQLLRERDQARQMEMQVLKNLALLGESASVLTHEIRTPITSLRHALRAVGEKLGVEDRVLVEEFIGNLNKIERMLGQTLSFAKPLKLQFQDTDLAELLDRCVREVGALPVMAGMSVEVRSEPGLRARVDPQLFGDVVTNLLRNAGEACNGNGHVEVVATREREALVVEVEDDGPGVPSNQRDEIFKPFRSSKDYGTGIGLAYCRKVVESHGGSIRLADRPGAGACFRIELGPGSAT
ncbi:MAG: hybrid sensor histidine kinase/response regulator [Planctomycetes bacterium]|nr:hybrid sensor histidine kinase/response regulator [Planctomycetota bacterium]